MKDVLSTREVAGVLGVSEARALTDYRGSAGGRPVVRNTVKVVAIVVFMTVAAAGVRLFFDWVFQWGAVK